MRYSGGAPSSPLQAEEVHEWFRNVQSQKYEQKEYLPQVVLVDPAKLPPPGKLRRSKAAPTDIGEKYTMENGATVELKHTKHRRLDEEGNVPIGTQIAMSAQIGLFPLAFLVS